MNRVKIYEWMFMQESRFETNNLEIIFCAAQIFDMYCAAAADTNYMQIAYAALVISSQYNDDDFEFIGRSNRNLNNLKIKILETIQFNIFPSKQLYVLFNLCTDCTRDEIYEAFSYLLASLFDYNVVTSNCEDVGRACLCLARKETPADSISEMSRQIKTRALNSVKVLSNFTKHIEEVVNLF